MPRTYKKKTEHGSWSSESLANAIDAVKQGMSQTSAAKRYGISISTLHRHYRGNLNALLCGLIDYEISMHLPQH